MRLINKKTLLVEWFPDGQVPPYVVLSHCWSGRETTLQEYSQECQLPKEAQSPGTVKVISFCEYIADRQEQYGWVDTCCIDKTSSSELQEAINSMWKWYREATLCVVFLKDVKARNDRPRTLRDLGKSEWWTRGWTLQELLSPQKLDFVDRTWNLLGSRDDLASVIETASGISSKLMGNPTKIRASPVGQRMSWLSKRKTTRVEDMAYCMLGILDINMAMLYGEGSKAFFRLQQEVLRTIDDDSIFLWTGKSETDLSRSTILAPNPACFVEFSRLGIRLDTYFLRAPSQITARGLELEIFSLRSSVTSNSIRVPLNCVREGDGLRPYLQLERYMDKERNRSGWRRVEHDGIRVMEQNEYATPDSEQRVFEDERRELARRHQRESAVLNRTHNKPPAFEVFDWEQEPIRRKVFIF